ncbi:MAG: hypothetical protein B7Z20_12115 [Sphingobium sp. 32-64-5]|nr:MAG: hypothetical protein B7Z20_12115 [Sphingobium sp. 32-64-5]
MLNVYQPSQIVAKEGDAAPFVEFIEYLVPDAAEREHLLKVMAHTVRYPGARVRHAVLLRSTAHGIGKSMLSGIWGELVGKSNVRKTTTGEIMGAFDSWAIMNTLNVIEELDHKSGLSMYNRLKDFITSDTATINEKHLQPRNWPLFSTFLMLSNRTAPLLIEECDRRLMVIDSHAVPREPDYYTRLAAWLADNAGVVRHYLDQIDLAAFNPHAPPPMTAAKSALIGRSKSVLLQDIGYLIHDREANLGRDIVTLRDVRIALVGAAGKSDRELGKALTELGAVRFGQVGTGSARKSLWGTRHRKYWEAACPQELLDESSRHEGMLPDVGMPDDFYRHHSTWPGLRSFLEDWALCAPCKDPG